MRLAELTKMLACAAVMLATCASHARAQCGGWVHDLESYGPEFLRYFAPRVIDRDGEAGAQIPRIVGVGIDRLVTKSDEDWSFLSERLGGDIYPLEAWDADGTGPMTPRLYFGRPSLESGNDKYLDSVPWPKSGAVGSHALAPVPGKVHDMRLTDPDGPGPARARPIVVCAGSDSGTTVVVLEWDGAAWIQRGSTLIGTSARVIVSPSSSGSGDEWIVYGNFHRPGPPFVNIIARYDGTNWVALGAGLQGGGVNSATMWDHDSNPSTARRLVVSGLFSESGTTRLNYVAMFDGTSWVSLGAGLANPTRGLASYVHVATGREELLVTTVGDFETDPGFAAFNGVTWREASPASSFDLERTDLQTWDPDGPLSDPPAALVMLADDYIHPPLEPTLSLWNGETWQPITKAAISSSSAQTSWDPDGNGPLRSGLAMISSSARMPQNTLALSTWDGVNWHTADSGIPGSTAFVISRVTAMASWDADGDGPQNPLLVLGGRFSVTIPGQPDILNVAGWNGESLVPLGEGLNGTSGMSMVEGLTSWDSDGDGPESPRLFAYGTITGSGSDTFKSVAQFDGEQWLPVGSGVWPETGSSIDCVEAVEPWDPDLDGPSHGSLLLGGRFSLVEGGPIISLAAWDGEALKHFSDPSLPTSLTTVGQIASIRDSRSGAEHPALLVGHVSRSECWDDPFEDYSECRTFLTTLLLVDADWTSYKTYESRQWRYYGQYFESGYYPPGVITPHDPDGNGPQSERLIFGHYRANDSSFHIGSYGFPEYTSFVGGPVAYDGVGTPYFYDDTQVDSVISVPLLPDLAIASFVGYFTELVVTNSYFDSVNPPRPIHDLARWMEGPPRILEVPEPRTNPETRTFGLTVHAIGGGDLGYQWTRNGVPLKVGVTARGSIVHSPGGPTLIISNASHLDEGEYQCRVINSCGSTLGPVLSMPFIHCAADANFDENVDILDLLDFLQAYGECEGLPMPCGSTANPDFNGDTLVDVLDFLDFLDRFGQGC